MRYLFLMRGVPGSGKSSFIPVKYKNLVIEPDVLRMLYSGLEHDIEGRPYISQKVNQIVWKKVYEILEERMKIGSTIFIDATHITEKSINSYKKYAEKYNYKTFVIDFSNIPFDVLIERNEKREEYKKVPIEVIKKKFNQLKNSQIPKWIKKTFVVPENIKKEEYSAFFENVLEEIYKEEFININTQKYKNLVFIGDIHGMYKEFEEILENIDFNQDYVVFLGDYFDRFPNEEELLKLFQKLEELSQKENVIFLRGNHELYGDYLKKYKEYIDKKNKIEKELSMLKTKFLNIKSNIKDIKKLENKDIIEEKLLEIARQKNDLYKNQDIMNKEYYLEKMSELKKIEKTYKFLQNYNSKKERLEKEFEQINKNLKETVKKLGHQKSETIKVFEKYGKLKNLINFNKKLKNYFLFKGKNKIYFANHGGYPIPLEKSKLLYINEIKLIKGEGEYGEEKILAENFEKNYPNYYQIHGHRNVYNLPPQISKNVLNLNGAAEYGEDLRMAKFDLNNDMLIIIKQIPAKRQTRYTRNKEFEEGKILELAKIHDHIKVSEIEPNIYSIKFTKTAFYERNWDKATIHARGLFIYNDGKEEKIIARGFPKFFNLNEMPESKLDKIKKWKYPLVVEEKSNGFLGIFSAYEKNGRIVPFIASKSTNKGTYANYFKELLEKNITNELLKYLKKNNLSLMFEVIHEKDPHIQEYETKNQLILIGAIKNEINAQPLDYIKVKQIYTKYFQEADNIRLKQRVKLIKNYEELKDLFKKDMEVPLTKENYIEGFVIYSKENKFKEVFKFKTRWYNFWKYMRKIKQNIENFDRKISDKQVLSLKNKLKERYKTNEEEINIGNQFIDFLSNLINKGINIKQKNIIELRKDFLEKLNLNNKLDIKQNINL